MQSAVQVAVLGSTGSIGRNTLAVIEASAGQLQVAGLSAHSRLAELAEQAARFRPRWVAVSDPAADVAALRGKLPPGTELLVGPDALERIVTQPTIDVVVAAIVGSAGLHSTWAAIDAGKRVALANKETLVMAGALVMERARRRGAAIVPVDSEHSAVFQSLQAGRREELRRVILTASGGPFRAWSRDRLAEVTVADALRHPTWNMGRKITIDSATLMNKALEIIEARWLFDLGPDQIGVVIHPQSIVHSMVEYLDGSVIAQLSPPDMKLPIQYALTFPERREGVADRMDWTQAMSLEFFPPDYERFPALELGLEAARTGGTTGAVLNAANEAAVAGFLAGELAYAEIVPACRNILDHHTFDPQPTLDDLVRLDRWAREEFAKWVCA